MSFLYSCGVYVIIILVRGLVVVNYIIKGLIVTFGTKGVYTVNLTYLAM